MTRLSSLASTDKLRIADSWPTCGRFSRSTASIGGYRSITESRKPMGISNTLLHNIFEKYEFDDTIGGNPA